MGSNPVAKCSQSPPLARRKVLPGSSDRPGAFFARAEKGELAPALEQFHIAANMTLAAQTIASNAIALTPAERADVAVAILDSFAVPVRSGDEVRELLQQRSRDLASGKDPGLTFDQVFGEPL